MTQEDFTSHFFRSASRQADAKFTHYRKGYIMEPKQAEHLIVKTILTIIGLVAVVGIAWAIYYYNSDIAYLRSQGL